MSYFVRVLAASDKVIPASEIQNQGKYIKLVSGTDKQWERIEIYAPEDNPICILERQPVSAGTAGETELKQLKDSIQGSCPVSAREWLRQYFTGVKTIYSFQLFGEQIPKDGWPVLGRIQNLLADLLDGIVQADKEGYYNDHGDYILWQMYEGAAGKIAAAVLGEKGQWISFQLNLTDSEAIERFKEGLPPSRAFLGRLLNR